NVVFRAKGTAAAVAKSLAAAFASEFGSAAKILLRTAAEWDQLIAGNPYAKAAAADPTKVHAALCEGTPDKQQLTALLKKTAGPEAFTTAKGVIYLRAPDGLGRSKFAAGLERACGVPATLRNWRTIEALQTLAAKVASG